MQGRDGTRRSVQRAWETLCSAIGLSEPVPVTYHVPQAADGAEPKDVRTREEDLVFSSEALRTVRLLKQGATAELPLVVSLAGGRKTMSSHLQMAMSLFADAGDELYHVLVRDEAHERGCHLYPGDPYSEEAGMAVDLVAVPFVPLPKRTRSAIDAAIRVGQKLAQEGNGSGDGSGRGGALPLAWLLRVASSSRDDTYALQLEVTGEECLLTLVDGAESMVYRLAPRLASLLVTFASAAAAEGGTVDLDMLIDDSLSDRITYGGGVGTRRRREVMTSERGRASHVLSASARGGRLTLPVSPYVRLFTALRYAIEGAVGELDVWENAGDVRRAVSKLKSDLEAQAPGTAPLLRFGSQGKSAYGWSTPPPLRISLDPSLRVHETDVPLQRVVEGALRGQPLGRGWDLREPFSMVPGRV